MAEQFTLLTVHAHPDDESSKGAGTVARYHAEGVRTVLVTCTGGEMGDILNPAMDLPEVKENIGEVRRGELERAAQIIGYDEVIMLGYKDSGMAGTEANEDPDCFAQAPLEEAVGRLVEIIRRERPQVIVTYDEDHSGYPHPDHIRTHEISVVAFEAAADPARFPDAGDPYQPLKLYYTIWSRQRMVAVHEKFIELGLESPFDEKWFERPWNEDKITTSIDISGYADVRMHALLAHETQVDPNSKFWFGLPPEVMREIHPFDEYAIAVSHVGTSDEEDDLFAGIRTPAASGARTS